MFGQSESFETARTGTTCSVNVIEHSSSYVLIRCSALLAYTFKKGKEEDWKGLAAGYSAVWIFSYPPPVGGDQTADALNKGS